MAFPVAAFAAAALPVVMQMFSGDKNKMPAPTPVGSGGGSTQFTPSTAGQQAQGQARMNALSQGYGSPRGSELSAMTQPPPITPAAAPDLTSGTGNASSMWANAGNAARLGTLLSEGFDQELPELPALPGAGFSTTQYVPTALRFGGQRLRTLYGL